MADVHIVKGLKGILLIFKLKGRALDTVQQHGKSSNKNNNLLIDKTTISKKK